MRHKTLSTKPGAVQEFIDQQFGVKYSVSGVSQMLHRLGFVYKDTTLIPGKFSEEAQVEFVGEYERLCANLSDDEVIVFGDGVHPCHNTVVSRAWIRKGECKQVPTNTGRRRVNINGVLELGSMKVVTHVCDTINADTTMVLFDKIQHEYRDKAKIHIIVDNARYYKNKMVFAYLAAAGCRIVLHFLPPYSPNLNLIERLWKYMKKYVISTKRRESFKEFTTDIENFFTTIDEHKDKLQKFIGTKMHLITHTTTA